MPHLLLASCATRAFLSCILREEKTERDETAPPAARKDIGKHIKRLLVGEEEGQGMDIGVVRASD